MNPMFGEWYRAASLDPQNVNLESRWAGIEKHKGAKELSFAAEVVRLFLDIGKATDGFLSAFRQPFFDADNSGFRMSDNDVELRVLAGVLIIEILHRKDAFADGVALVVLAAAAPDLRKKVPILKEVLPATSNYLFDRSALVRRPGPTKSKSALTSVEAELTEITQLASTNPAAIWKPTEAAIRHVSENVSKVSEFLESRILHLQKRQDHLAEEANIVWWLFAGADRVTLESYSGQTAVEAALFCARDLASLTVLLPPPLAAPAYIERCLSTHHDVQVTLEEVALSKASEVLTVTPSASTSLFPFLSLQYLVSQGTPAKTAVKNVVAQFSLKPGSAPTQTASLQYYRELLAARVLEPKA
jgi:hypothetical protein